MIVHFYCTPSGRSPIEEFIQDLPKVDRAKCLEVIAGLETYGLNYPRAQLKPLRGKIWEIKFQTQGGGYRILYVMLSGDEMVLLHVFKKASQKTPPKELELAEKRLKEVLS